MHNSMIRSFDISQNACNRQATCPFMTSYVLPFFSNPPKGFFLCLSRSGTSLDGCMLEPLGKPHFDDRLPRHTESFCLFIQRLNHPDREVYIDSLLFPPGFNCPREIQMLGDIFSSIKSFIKYLCLHKFQASLFWIGLQTYSLRISFNPSIIVSISSGFTRPIFLPSRSLESVRIWLILTQDRFGNRDPASS